jgi:hypothetical protein
MNSVRIVSVTTTDVQGLLVSFASKKVVIGRYASITQPVHDAFIGALLVPCVMDALERLADRVAEGILEDDVGVEPSNRLNSINVIVEASFCELCCNVLIVAEAAADVEFSGAVRGDYERDQPREDIRSESIS